MNDRPVDMPRIRCWIVGLAWALCLAGTLRSDSLAGRPAVDPKEVLLILHADDLGMCHSLNTAGIRALDAGCVTSGSMMVPCPWFPEMAAYARAHPELDLGLHLTLTSEWEPYRWRPVASRRSMSGLLDPSGHFWRTMADIRDHAGAREVRKEMQAQIDLALRWGLKPTHLDAHMGVLFSNPKFIEAYIRLASAYGIPCMLPKASPDIAGRLNAFQSDLYASKQLKWFRPPNALIDHLFMDGVEGRSLEERKASYYALLRDLKPGVNEILLHLGLPGEELEAILPYAEEWGHDYTIFVDPRTCDLIRALKIRLIGWKDLAPAPPARCGP